ncbi:MAG: hypothetical protein ACLRMZ_14280 [Blautia marasmi]
MNHENHNKICSDKCEREKMRTAVMLLSILLSSSLLFVSFSIGASYESAQRKMARGMAGNAAVSVSAKDGPVYTDDIPDLTSIDAKAGILKGTALYHEDGYYETVDLAAADLTELEQINPPRLADSSEIKDFFGSQVILPDRFTSKYNIKKGYHIPADKRKDHKTACGGSCSL